MKGQNCQRILQQHQNKIMKIWSINNRKLAWHRFEEIKNIYIAKKPRSSFSKSTFTLDPGGIPQIEGKNTIFSSVFELICINIARVPHSKNKMSSLQKDLRSICFYHRSKQNSEKFWGRHHWTHKYWIQVYFHTRCLLASKSSLFHRSPPRLWLRELPHASQSRHTHRCL